MIPERSRRGEYRFNPDDWLWVGVTQALSRRSVGPAPRLHPLFEPEDLADSSQIVREAGARFHQAWRLSGASAAPRRVPFKERKGGGGCLEGNKVG